MLNAILFAAANIDDPDYRQKMFIFLWIIGSLMVLSFIFIQIQSKKK
jgi:hypothetical protein